MEDPLIEPFEDVQAPTSFTWRMKAVAVLGGIATIGFVGARGTVQHAHGALNLDSERYTCHTDVCLERGSPDGDCCALSHNQGCDSGFTAYTGDYCDENYAKATCCLADTGDLDSTVADLASELRTDQEQMRNVQAQLRNIFIILFGEGGTLAGQAEIASALNLEESRHNCNTHVCLERGSRDKDCCSLSSNNGCDSGFRAYASASCSHIVSSAVSTCCLPESDMDALDNTVADLMSEVHAEQEQMRNVQTQIRNLTTILFSEGGTPAEHAEIVSTQGTVQHALGLDALHDAVADLASELRAEQEQMRTAQAQLRNLSIILVGEGGSLDVAGAH